MKKIINKNEIPRKDFNVEISQSKPQEKKLKFWFIMMILFFFIFVVAMVCLNFFCKESTRKEKVFQENRQNLNTSEVGSAINVHTDAPDKVTTPTDEGGTNESSAIFSESTKKEIENYAERLSTGVNDMEDMQSIFSENAQKEIRNFIDKLSAEKQIDTIGAKTPEEALLMAATAFKESNIDKALEMFSDFDHQHNYQHNKIRRRFGFLFIDNPKKIQEFASSLKNAKLTDENDGDLNDVVKDLVQMFNLYYNIPTKLYATKTLTEKNENVISDIDYFFLSQFKDENWSISAFLIDNIVEPIGAATPEEALDFAAFALEEGDVDKAFLMFDSHAHDTVREMLDFPGEEKELAKKLRNARLAANSEEMLELSELEITIKMHETDIIVPPESKTVTIHFYQLLSGNWVIEFYR